ncbi:1-deoxy-D-xylulose-5-phosphate reductoisomerase [Zavarzinella formosa]|uniref:1-deoxy-D-xylulose-5-phosphate reductoisomerase n=1 Tax=Zavarzinella formosa TaxID=360055 RepID=UPI0002DFD52E|nr:1-deoxy-D-xylulose-5-phosphate reductoisomerase [Zavarzinella formosa]
MSQLTAMQRKTVPDSGRRRVVILGSTGSIGCNTLDVLRLHPDRFEVIGLVAHRNAATLRAQAGEFEPKWVALTGEEHPEGSVSGPWATVHTQTELLERIQAPDVDIVVSAIVGAAGLLTTWAAVDAGKDVALANKETMVLAGSLVMERATQTGSRILPVDSEHSAIFQAMEGHRDSVERVVLTGSGGPFRGKSREALKKVTVAEALNHPTWKMGPKITVDSATLMNKALEVIEAKWLFGLDADQIRVIVHPESIVHSFVEFRDGSVLAQLSPPDMRLPIQFALTYPERWPSPTRRMNWTELNQLRFEQPDPETFPALSLGFRVARDGGTSGAVLNAANEVAVERFLAGEISFPEIPRIAADVLNAHSLNRRPTLDELLAADRWARTEVARWITNNRTR